jgi:hypothetical protein
MPKVNQLPVLNTATTQTYFVVTDHLISKRLNYKSLTDVIGNISTGSTGYTGSSGPVGFVGSRGYPGNIGYTGSASDIPGPPGPIGPIGYTGSAGTGGSGIPGGNNTEIQFNKNGSFSGNSTFTFNTATLVVSAPSIVLSKSLTLPSIYESFTKISAATGIVDHDFSLGSIFYHTSIANTFTVNITNLGLQNNHVTNVVLILNQGDPAYIPPSLSINGAAQVIVWHGGAVPSGNINKSDMVSFSILNITGSYTVFGQLISFG